MSRKKAQIHSTNVLGDGALLKLAARFMVCFAVLFGISVWLRMRTSSLDDFEVVTAGAATALMNITGVAATSAGRLISVPGRQLLIGPDCTGLTIILMLIALVVAYPVKPSSRAVGAVAGIAILLIANLARLVAIAHLSRAPDFVFYPAHDFLFQVGMVAVAIAVWTAWLMFARTRES